MTVLCFRVIKPFGGDQNFDNASSSIQKNVSPPPQTYVVCVQNKLKAAHIHSRKFMHFDWLVLIIDIC